VAMILNALSSVMESVTMEDLVIAWCYILRVEARIHIIFYNLTLFSITIHNKPTLKRSFFKYLSQSSFLQHNLFWLTLRKNHICYAYLAISSGSSYNLCPWGSDCEDCGTRQSDTGAEDEPHVPETCINSCKYRDDGECDDGGPGAGYQFCEFGTDCNDCKPRHGTNMNCVVNCTTLISDRTNCSSALGDICGSANLPMGFNFNDSLYNLCPLECVENENSCNDLQIGSYYDRYDDFCKGEVASYLDSYQIHACTAFTYFGFAPEDVNFVMSVCPKTCGSCHQHPAGTIVLVNPEITKNYVKDSFWSALGNISSAIRLRNISIQLKLNLYDVESLNLDDEENILQTCSIHLRIP
jgi:hypothetical protein